MPRGPRRVDPKVTLKKLIRAQLNNRYKHWTGTGVEIKRTTFHLNAGHRQRVQDIGQIHGCHSCGTKVDQDSNQPWVGDHIPPVNLTARARLYLGCPGKTYLFPQCYSCANAQAQLVKRLNANPRIQMSGYEHELIFGGRDRSRGIRTYGKKVSVSEGEQIQRLGEREGCHSCDSKNPASKYIADHTFPQEFCTTYMSTVFESLGISYPDRFELRPQCPRCSTRQGGQMRRIRMLAMEYAKKNRITTYKY